MIRSIHVPFIKFNYKDCTERKFDGGNSGEKFFSAPYVDCSFSTVFLVFIKTNEGFEEIISFVTFRGSLFR